MRIVETCRCGASIELTDASWYDFAPGAANHWRKEHHCTIGVRLYKWVHARLDRCDDQEVSDGL